MRTSFRAKLMLSYLALLVVMSAAVYLYLNRSLHNAIISNQRENLANEARLTAVIAARDAVRLAAVAPALALEAGRSVTARVTIIEPDGRVVGDSEVPAGKLAELENHRDRPEVQSALQGGKGTSIRYSATLRTDMLYVAVPLAVADRPAGVVRLALPLAAVDKAMTEMHTMLGIGLLAAFVLSLVLSDILARVTSRPLLQVAAVAAGISEGDFRRRLPTAWRDEFGGLARSMNEMAGRLEEQLNALTDEKSRLDAILTGMGEGLIVIAADGGVVLVNPAFCRLFGVGREVVGAPLSHISRHPALLDAFNRVRQSGGELVEELTLPVAGEKVLLTHWVPLPQTGSTGGVVAVFHDISDLKRLESIRKDFVANVSHELRTPVTVIKGYAETLLDGLIAADPAQAERFLAIIRSHSDRLSALLTDLLRLSELEAANFALELAPVPLDATIRRAGSLVAEAAAAKEIAVCLAAEPLPTVLADQGRLEQVLVNLLDNAIKYTPAGGRVALTVATEGEFLRIAVRDSGIGVPEASIPRLFERFYRVDAGRSRAEGGTGLGLAIVKHIVQLHGGTVRAANNSPEPGATFSFTLRPADS